MDVSSKNIALSRTEGKQLILNACNIVWQIYWDSCHTGRHYHKVQVVVVVVVVVVALYCH